MTDLLSRLIQQLDTLVAFLSLGHAEVYSLVESSYENWVPHDQQSTLPESAHIFEIQISHSAFLLGYSYFEAFLSDCMKAIYRSRPKMLPGDKKISFRDIVELPKDYDLIEIGIEREIRGVLYKSVSEQRKYFKERLNINWPDFPELEEASALRNCLLHNGSIADNRLANASQSWSEGDTITLSSSQVHSFGIHARGFARDLWPKVVNSIQVPNS